jgi:uncharacterized membrane protein (UPF0127 family)
MGMKIKINNTNFNVKLQTSVEGRTEGMMGKRFNNFDGMLFIMDKNEEQSFWMKNCIISLDIIFIINDKITKIHENCPPCYSNDCPTYSGQGNIVLELPAGSCSLHNIKVGDKLAYLKKSS